jgi:hypothetical protein
MRQCDCPHDAQDPDTFVAMYFNNRCLPNTRISTSQLSERDVLRRIMENKYIGHEEAI